MNEIFEFFLRLSRSVLDPLEEADLMDINGIPSVTPGSFRDGFASSFLMILTAEIADKTFFIACIMAMRYNRLIVFSGAWGALVLMTFLSCALGHLVTNQDWISQETGKYSLGSTKNLKCI